MATAAMSMTRSVHFIIDIVVVAIVNLSNAKLVRANCDSRLNRF